MRDMPWGNRYICEPKLGAMVTGCVLCELRAEEEDKDEHRAHNSMQQNQMAALQQLRLILRFL
jgi:hypothetical protein